MNWKISPEDARWSLNDAIDLRIHPKTADALMGYRDDILSAKLHQLTAVVTVPERQWQRHQSFLEFFAFGAFSNLFSCIEALATPLSKRYSYTGILPIIHPIPVDNGAEMATARQIDETRRKFARYGIRLIEEMVDAR